MTTPNPKSELAWQLAHYQNSAIEPPARIVSNPALTEGEMMTDDEMGEFVKDSIATLRIMSDRNSARYEQLYEAYKADLSHLVKLGRMTEDDYNELTHPDNLRF